MLYWLVCVIGNSVELIFKKALHLNDCYTSWLCSVTLCCFVLRCVKKKFKLSQLCHFFAGQIFFFSLSIKNVVLHSLEIVHRYYLYFFWRPWFKKIRTLQRCVLTCNYESLSLFWVISQWLYPFKKNYIIKNSLYFYQPTNQISRRQKKKRSLSIVFFFCLNSMFPERLLLFLYYLLIFNDEFQLLFLCWK